MVGYWIIHRSAKLVADRKNSDNYLNWVRVFLDNIASTFDHPAKRPCATVRIAWRNDSTHPHVCPLLQLAFDRNDYFLLAINVDTIYGSLKTIKRKKKVFQEMKTVRAH